MRAVLVAWTLVLSLALLGVLPAAADATTPYAVELEFKTHNGARLPPGASELAAVQGDSVEVEGYMAVRDLGTSNGLYAYAVSVYYDPSLMSATDFVNPHIEPVPDFEIEMTRLRTGNGGEISLTPFLGDASRRIQYDESGNEIGKVSAINAATNLFACPKDPGDGASKDRQLIGTITFAVLRDPGNTELSTSTKDPDGILETASCNAVDPADITLNSARLVSPDPCPFEVDGDGVVDPTDLYTVFIRHGNVEPDGECSCDINVDGVVDPIDFLMTYWNQGLCSAPRSGVELPGAAARPGSLGA
jgi:hypothetical protein